MKTLHTTLYYLLRFSYFSLRVFFSPLASSFLGNQELYLYTNKVKSKHLVLRSLSLCDNIYLAEFLKTYLKTGQNIRTGTWR